MEADAAFGRAARIVILHAITLENTSPAVVHANRNREMILAHRLAQESVHVRIELEYGCGLIQLRLGNSKWVQVFSHCHEISIVDR